MKNYAESVRNRLSELGRRENIWFNYLITRYLHERLLYRLSISAYSEKFCLKGGTLLYALEGISARQTRDIDFLGRQLSSDSEGLKRCFSEITSIDFEQDGVTFDSTTIETREIVKEGNYRGIRLEFWASIGQIREKMQVDIGFGDRIVPASVQMQFPTLLELPAPKIHVYSVESVIAEKFHAMVILNEINSRMKDFYDLYSLLRPEKFNPSILKIAILETFKTRDTLIPQDSTIFSPNFSQNPDRQKLWEAFLKKSHLPALDFYDVIKHIERELKTIIALIQDG